MQLTDWYPSSIKPARPGVYELRTWCGYEYAYFNGKYWASSAYSREWAFALKKSRSRIQFAKWRGLANKPE